MQATTRQENQEYLFQWEQVCAEFKEHYSLEEFKSWLQNCKFEQIKGKTAIINAPTRFVRDRIQSEYRHKLELFWARININIEEVRVTIGRSKIESTPDIPKTAQIIQLPLWPELARGTPNSVLRGALFSAIDPRRRQAFQRTHLVDEKDLKIIYGSRLYIWRGNNL
jgi:chromosomal replication initiation ATPase DnaA